MLGFLDRIKKVAACDANILIRGDAGSGNECVALLIHQLSSRSGGIFLARNCTAIPTAYFAAEMYGHSGSAPGTYGQGEGAFVDATKGTLFLDEIGDLTYGLQTELLLALKKQCNPSTGAETCVNISPRIICTTSRDLRQSIRLNKFRDDLYYTIATVVLTVLPLRERREDIVPLARLYAGQASNWQSILSLEAENQLHEYDWPGNIRELRTMMDQAARISTSQTIQARDLNFANAVRMDDGSQLLADVERRHILNVIKVCKGNKTDAAKALGVARSTLVLKLRAISEKHSALS